MPGNSLEGDEAWLDHQAKSGFHPFGYALVGCDLGHITTCTVWDLDGKLCVYPQPGGCRARGGQEETPAELGGLWS